MSVTAWLRSHGPDAAWGLFAAANLAFMVVVPAFTTVPIHFIWLSLILMYWYRSWRLRTALAVVAAVALLTTGVLTYAGVRGAPFSELAEVPLMAVICLVMIWYAWRRDLALQEVNRLARSARDFVQNASHELRTPITIARGHLELIRGQLSGRPLAEDAEVILDELKRLSRISDQLLVLAASETPDFLGRSPVSLADVVGGAADRWRATAPRNWTVDIATDGQMLLADEERLVGAIDALLENAVKHTREGDSICVSVHPDDETAVISVTDTGSGIAPEHLPRIFERFYRVPHAERNGTGLGLAIAKAVAEAHDGTISVQSVPGERTRFTMRLSGLGHPPVPVSDGSRRRVATMAGRAAGRPV